MHDLVMVWLAWFVTNLARFAVRSEAHTVDLFAPELPVVLVAQGRPMPLIQEAAPIEDLRAALAQVLQQLTASGMSSASPERSKAWA